MPSRLLFACDEETIARRVMAFCSQAEASSGKPVPLDILRPGQHKSCFDCPQAAADRRTDRVDADYGVQGLLGLSVPLLLETPPETESRPGLGRRARRRCLLARLPTRCLASLAGAPSRHLLTRKRLSGT